MLGFHLTREMQMLWRVQRMTRIQWMMMGALAWSAGASGSACSTGDDDGTSPAENETQTPDDEMGGDDDASSTPSPSPDPGDDDTSGGTPSGDDDDDTGTGERTLENCQTSIADDVPDFFRELFHCLEITLDGGSVRFHTVDLPPHRSYYYGEGDPNYEPFDYSRGSQYRPNPNEIVEQDITVMLPLNPISRGLTITGDLVDGMAGTSEYEYHGAPGGIALDGVALFHGFAAPGDDLNEEKYTFDAYNAHPAEQGNYHYHTWSKGPLEALAYSGYTTSTEPGVASVEIYGIMCDGTVVLGCTEADGSEPPTSLDAQGGHVSNIVSEDETVWFSNRYHTHVCEGGREFTPEIQYYKDCGVPMEPPQ